MTAFLSYSRRDQTWVDALEAELNSLGITPWIDRRRIPVGTPWLAEIRDGIEVATLVVACRSRAFDESVHCMSELAIAESLGVEVFDVSVDAAPAAVAADIADSLRSQPPERAQASELLARARSWDRAKRPRRLLLPRRDIRRLAGAPIPEDERSALVRSFLRRSRRKRLVTTAYVVAAAFALMVVMSIPRTLERMNEEQNVTTDELFDRQVTAEALAVAADVDYYAALETSSSLGATEAAIDAAALSELLAMRTPDDAFAVAEGPATLAHPVDDAVVFATGDGDWFTRASSPGAPVVDASAPDSPSGPAEARIDGGAVEVTVDGRLHRLVPLVRAGLTAEVSPDLRLLAVGTAGGVDLYDLESSTLVGRLVSAGGATTSLAWTSDSSGVWGAVEGWLLHWTVRSGMVWLDEPEEQYRAVMPTDGGAWVLEETGRLLLVEDGTIDREVGLPLSAFSAAITHDQQKIVSIGSDAVMVTRVAEGTTTQLDLDCALHRPAAAPADAVVALTCGEELVFVDATTATVDGSVQLPPSAQGQPVAFGPDGSVWIPGIGAELFRFSDGSLSVAGTSVFRACPASWFGVDVSDAGLVHPFGNALGTISCTGYVDTTDGSRWQPAWLEFDVPYRSRASVFNASGDALVTAFSNGMIVVWPTANIVPQVALTEVSGDVFDLAVDGPVGYAVTRSGMMATFPMPPVPSNADLGEQARERVAWAREIGLIGGPS